MDEHVDALEILRRDAPLNDNKRGEGKKKNSVRLRVLRGERKTKTKLT